jgi:DNA repair protein RecO (recombination protein O)
LIRQHDEAYVLRTQVLGEADLIVSLLARHHGKVRGVARSARRSRKRFGGLLEPLTRVRAVWIEREGRELHRLEALEGLRSHAAMQAEPARQAACAVLCEVTEVFAHEGQPEPRGFKLLGAVLDALEAGADTWTVVRYFELWTLRLNGLFPNLAVCARCSRTLEPSVVRVGRRTGVVCRDCAAESGEPTKLLGAEDREFLDAARARPPAELERRSASRPGGALELLLRGRLEEFAERRFRTYRHLRAAAAAEDGADR